MLRPVLREEERVTALELFFDLVFVLAITQCTALMASDPTWAGLARGLLVLAVLWWAWTGYAWLTSVVNPEEGVVRLSIFGAMAALLVAALCVPTVFEGSALLFAARLRRRCGSAHIALFILAGRGDPVLRRSVVDARREHGGRRRADRARGRVRRRRQGALWVAAVVLDFGGPFFFGAEGWRLDAAPLRRAARADHHHRPRRVDRRDRRRRRAVVDAGVVVAAVLGMAVAAAFWWLYFDVVALVAARHLAEAPRGKVQNEMARDSYSYLHFPMVAGIVLVALGLKKTLERRPRPRHGRAVALLGGAALYLLGHIAFRLRNVGTLNRQRLVAAGAARRADPGRRRTCRRSPRSRS